MDGFIVVDKPAGMTSHDVVNAVRRLTGLKKVGHTGTLDPFATGVLPVALGEGTKAIPFLDETRKEYRAVMKRVLLLLALGLGCSSQVIVAPDGYPATYIKCNPNRPERCYQKAERLCPYGYHLVTPARYEGIMIRCN